MIEIRPERRADALEPLYKQRGLKINENSTAAVAYDGETVIGFCLFDMEDSRSYIYWHLLKCFFLFYHHIL